MNGRLLGRTSLGGAAIDRAHFANAGSRLLVAYSKGIGQVDLHTGQVRLLRRLSGNLGGIAANSSSLWVDLGGDTVAQLRLTDLSEVSRLQLPAGTTIGSISVDDQLLAVGGASQQLHLVGTSGRSVRPTVSPVGPAVAVTRGAVWTIDMARSAVVLLSR